MVNFHPVPTWNRSTDGDLPIFRRQHDNRRGFNNASGQDSVGGGVDDYDWYVIPSCTAKSVLVSSGVASAVVAVVLAVIVVVVVAVLVVDDVVLVDLGLLLALLYPGKK